MKLIANALALSTGCSLLITGTAQAAPKVEIVLPLQRNALQTNESIPLVAVRSDTAALPADTLAVAVKGADGSVLNFTFPAAAVAEAGGVARAVEHLNLDARLLRPGTYTVEVTVNGATATQNLEVYSALRQSTFKLINWGSPKGAENQRRMAKEFGYNTMYDKPNDFTNYIRAGVDVIPVNIMSGGHQMDLRSEADWSDPLVTRGGTRRASRVAFQYRTFPNFTGINFYDEPGLTWHKHPVTGEWTPHGVPSQVTSYESAFNKTAPQYNKVDPAKAESVAEWKNFSWWKLGFMDAGWREAAFGVSQVRPDLISNTQSQYGWSAFTDGYYFNVTRSLPVVSGHGGYDDLNGGYFCPSYFLEMSRARDRSRPNWYLPTWYNSTANELTRVEQYLSFADGIQGLMTPPWNEPTGGKPVANDAIKETNAVMGRVGTIFNTMPPTAHPVAVLYSMSNNLHLNAADREVNYAHGTKHGAGLLFTYLAGQISQQPVDAVVEEDVLDGTLAAKHRAIVLPSLVYLEPRVVTALEQFIAGGGLVYKTSDTTVDVKGAIDLGITPQLPEQAKADALFKEILASTNRDWTKMQPYQTVGKFLEGATPYAKALTAQLAKAGIAPVYETDKPEVVAQRHASGDVEYIFAINATNDRAQGVKMAILPVSATIKLPADGRPVYDAMKSVPLSEGKTAAFTGKNQLSAKLDFIPGEMKVFARTARPIGGVRLATPTVDMDLTRESAPLQLSLSAAFVDATGRLLNGSVPMQVKVVDPLGVVRYDLYRASKEGVLSLQVPLAANDAAGNWQVTVTELLSGKSDTVPFAYKPSSRNGAVMGTTARAVMVSGEEANLFRFVRNNHDITIVPGTGDKYTAQAERLKKILTPWGVTCTIMDAATASKGRVLTEEEATTWIGLNYASRGQIKPNDTSMPVQTGFAVKGAAILLGTPEDNPIIKSLQAESFLPFKPAAGTFPGPQRGYLAWQRDAIGPAQESVTLIATDAAGMDEAIGTFYEAAAGLQSLTRWVQPTLASVTPASMVPAAAAK